MTSYPPFVNLGIVRSRPRSRLVDARGEEAASPDQLPDHILGCRLDAASFRLEEAPAWKALLGRSGRRWTARWAGLDSGTWVSAGWDSSDGWRFTYAWHGEQVFSANGFKEASLLEFYSRAAMEKLPGLVEEHAPRMPLAVLKTPAGAPVMAGFPDGVAVALTLPVHAALLGEAVSAFKSIKSLSLPGAVAGLIVLRPAVKLVRSGEMLSRLYFQSQQETGVPCPMLPERLEDGRIAVHALRYELRLLTAYYQAPELCRHFEPLMQRNPEGWRGAFQASSSMDLNAAMQVPVKDGWLFWEPLPGELGAALQEALKRPAGEALVQAFLEDAGLARRQACQMQAAMNGGAGPS